MFIKVSLQFSLSDHAIAELWTIILYFLYIVYFFFHCLLFYQTPHEEGAYSKSVNILKGTGLLLT